MIYQIDKWYSFSDFVQIIIDIVQEKNIETIGITGMSCIGKSTFSKKLREMLLSYGSAQIICVDNYLYDNLRGDNSYLKANGFILKPESYNWKHLQYCIAQLRKGNNVSIKSYQRGIGWNSQEKLIKSDYLIIEGLFLNSIPATDFLSFDYLIDFYADELVVEELRVKRDSYYRANYKGFTRTIEESIQEARDTVIAYNDYLKVNNSIPSMRVFVNYDKEIFFKIVSTYPERDRL